MTWNDVAEWCRGHTCFERQRTGLCSCKGKQACFIGQSLADEAERLASGENGDTEAIAKFIARKTCHASRNGRACNHRGCIRAERIHAWVCETLKHKDAA
jgi:hypothetical protein